MTHCRELRKVLGSSAAKLSLRYGVKGRAFRPLKGTAFRPYVIN